MAIIQQDFLVKNGMTVRNTATISTLESFLTTATNSVSGLATLKLNFISGDLLDPRIEFTRVSGASYVGEDGIIKYAAPNQPRFEYSNTGTPLGLLIEEQRTNLIFPSIINYSPWVIDVAATTFNATLAPDNSLSAISIQVPPSSSYTAPYREATVTTSTSYTWSTYVKLGTLAAADYKFAIYDSTNFAFIAVDIIPTVTVTSDSWSRITYRFITPATCVQARCYAYRNGNTGAGGTVYLWGSQLEPGQYATSYIPTVSASATRTADSASITGSAFTPWFNPLEGTWIAEFDTLWSGGASLVTDNPGVLAINDINYISGVSSYNGHSLSLQNNTSISGIRYSSRSSKAVSVSTAVYPNLGSYVTAGTVYKVIAGYDTNFLECGANGLYGSGGDANSGILTFNRLDIGYQRTGGTTRQLNGHIKQIAYCPQRLPTTTSLLATSATTVSSTSLPDVAPRVPRIANTSNFIVQQGVVVKQNLEVPDVDKYYVTTQTRPTAQSALNLNFLKGTLDPRVQFIRASQGTYTGPDGLIKVAGVNQPRFNYSSTSTGTCLGLLFEEPRINLYRYSNDFHTAISLGYAFWDGSIGLRQNNLGISTTTIYAMSVYLKVNTAHPSHTMLIDISDGPGRSVSLASVTSSTWTRITTSATYGSGSDFADIRIQGLAGNYSLGGSSFTITPPTTRNYGIAPNGKYESTRVAIYNTQTNALMTDIELWGFQVEAGLFPTTLIPTASASATRSGDLSYIRGQNFFSWYNNKQGTFIVEADSQITSPDAAGVYRWAMAIFGPTSDFIGMFKGNNNNNYGFRIGDAYLINNFGPSVNNVVSSGTVFRAALSYAPGSQFATFNGVTTSTGVVSNVPDPSAQYMQIGNGDNYWQGHIRRITYYDQKLSNTVTQAISIV